MGKAPTARAATVGVAEHGNAAILVTVNHDGALMDRRRVNLTRAMPTHPYHHEGSWAVGRYADSPWAKKISLADAIALVERVREAAAQGASAALESLSTEVSIPIDRIAIRICPPLPTSIEECIRDTRAASMADSIMYRTALGAAAEGRGWRVHWYDRDTVSRDAATALGEEDIGAHLAAMGKPLGPPWQATHKLAAAAAIAASHQ
ncbi:MAG TPA: hypothetical protein VGH91_05500 [Gammaproteobacteria bacterium]|jgi:hypothetical protein